MRAPVRVASRPSLVFRYIVSSTEMRHIERAERCVYVGSDAAGLPLIWGEITDCGEACNANLADLLLEYAMSMEGSSDPSLWAEACRTFAEQISTPVAGIAAGDVAEPDAPARIALAGMLRSMAPGAAEPDDSRGLGFADCPLCSTASAGGTRRVADRAHDLFLDLCRETLRAAAPGWAVSSAAGFGRSPHPLRLTLRSP